MAKHEAGTTLGSYPQLYPYVLEHINEQPIQTTLRESVSTMSEAVMMGAPDEAQFFAWLIRLHGVKKAVEIGVFRGTTTLAIALALPADGKVIALDVSDEYALPGKAAWAEAGVAHKIDFRVGPAVSSLEAMLRNGERETVDFVFIDADKEKYDQYYEFALSLLKPGGVVAVDNVLRAGTVILPPSQQNPGTKAIVFLNEKIKHDKRVDAVMLPVADGCYLVRKRQSHL